MKEILYLDTDLMNSMLAQLDEGIINSFSFEENMQESETEGQQSAKGKKARLRAQAKLSTGILPGGELLLGSNLENNGNETTIESRTILDGQKDILNKAFHDYALDILQDKLLEKEILKTGPEFIEGDLFLSESTFKFFDFEFQSNVIDMEAMSQFILYAEGSPISDISEALEILERKKKGKLTSHDQGKVDFAEKMINKYESTKPLLNMLNMFKTYNNYASKIFGNSSIIRFEDIVGIIKKEYLRVTPESLSLRTNPFRNVKFLARVIGTKNEVYDGSLEKVLDVSDFDQIPNLFSDMLLGSFGVIKKGDIIVTPIAIYFE
ncbi:DUF6414 family protein [Niallia sp. 03133]|uniref:DUF6414 family protein n=1 Tax=Niallia sp. 03133 TaxID=3458060 RepID=UPI004044B152